MAGSRPLGLQIPPVLDLDDLIPSHGTSPVGSAVSSAASSPIGSPFGSPQPSPRPNSIPSAGRTLALETLRRVDLALPGIRARRDSEGSLSSGVGSPVVSPRLSGLNTDAVQHDDDIPSPYPYLLSRVREGKSLGHGSFGQVFQADYIRDDVEGSNPQPNIPVVLKKLSTDKRGCPNQMRAFRDELTAMHGLNGVSSPRLMDYNLNPRSPGYLMSKADGIALNKFDGLNPETQPDPLVREQTAKKLAKAMLEALETFHGRGFCHRDIKPDNVFVDTLSDGSYKITFVDLGFTTPVDKAMEGEFGNSKYTISCDEDRSAASIDLFAVGATLNAMACSGDHDVFLLQPSTAVSDSHDLPTNDMFAFVKYLCSGEHESIAPVLNHDWLRMG
ncbi:MAG: serine/threonine-protein kinase [Limnobacter sp.]|nr:serine/threonine-protein kinase [Limnobacter sp.]